MSESTSGNAKSARATAPVKASVGPAPRDNPGACSRKRGDIHRKVDISRIDRHKRLPP
jgi:hypothetical protein